VCGVTPYDTAHLGHARAFLCSACWSVTWRPRAVGPLVQNVTDVDESILQRAARDRESWRAWPGARSAAFSPCGPWMAAAGHRRTPREIRQCAPLARRLLRARTRTGSRRRPLYDMEASPVRSASRFAPAGCGRSSPPRTTRGSMCAKRHPLDFALWRRVTDGRPCEPIRPRSTGIASRVLGDGATPSGIAARHSRRQS
jgi:L-cysteine:1D-myo-inositol 2-amino-2-deoxy-alpha-D-glucopyranoside ligase